MDLMSKAELLGNFGEFVGARIQNMSANARLMANSETLAEIAVQAYDAGFPSRDSLDALDHVEKFRWRQWMVLQYLNIENLHYQYELGLLEREFYEGVIVERIKLMGDIWSEAGFTATMGRPGFHAEIENVLSRSQPTE